MMRYFIVMLMAFSIVLASCSGNNSAIPRRTAYPRIVAIDTVMTQVPNLPVRFLVNSSASLSENASKGWLDVKYDDYNAILHITFTSTSPNKLSEIIENRMERLILNTGGRSSKQTEFVNNFGFHVYLSETDGIATPIQFIASDDSTLVISGAYYLEDVKVTENIDSISPVIDILRSDLMRCLSALSYE